MINVSGRDPYSHHELIQSTERKILSVQAPVRQYRAIGSINEQFVQGNQWAAAYWQNGEMKFTQDVWFDDESVPRTTINLVNNLMLTWSSLLTKDRPTAKAVAQSEDPEDLFQAEIAQRIIEYLANELDTAQKAVQVVQYACQHGVAGFKVFYDVEDGSVRLEPISIFNYWIDLAPRYQDARWVIFESILDEEEARERLELAGLNPDDVGQISKMKFTNSVGEQREGYSLKERWEKPCRDYPNGLFCAMLGEHVLETMDFPYVFETDNPDKPDYVLPIVLMKVRNVRDSAYGMTNLTDVINLQRLVNETFARETRIMRQTSQVHLILPKELQESFDPSRDNVIFFDKSIQEGARLIQYTQPPTISPELSRLRNEARDSMSNIMGINDITSGQKTRSISGRAIENIAELDSQKNADAVKNLETMLSDMWRLLIALVARFYTDERKIKITNGTGFDIMSFNGADIDGVDIKLEPASEIDSLSSIKEAATAEKLQAGIATPEELVRAKKSPGYTLSQQKSRDVIEQYLAGADLDLIMPMPDDVDWAVFVDVLRRYKSKAIAEKRKVDWIALDALEKDLQSFMARAEEAAPPPPADDPTLEPLPPEGAL